MTGNSCAAVLAPHVDRLVLTVHLRMRRRRDEVAAIVAGCGVPSPALLIDLRPFLLESRRVSLSLVAAYTRFLPPEQTERILDSLAGAGVLAPTGGDFDALDPAVCFADAATRLQADEMALAWSDGSDAVAPAATMALAVLERVPHDASLVIFEGLRSLAEPAHNQAYVLHHRLTVLRYWRTDVHASVLAEAGLTPAQAVNVDAGWRGRPLEPGAIAAQDLERWFGEGGSLSSWGRRRRAAIEEATNRRLDEVLREVDGTCDLPAVLEAIPT